MDNVTSLRAPPVPDRMIRRDVQPRVSAGATAESAVIVRSVAELRSEWIALRARTAGPSFYQSFEWCAAWTEACRAAGLREDVRIVTVREAGRLVLVWPLAARRRGAVTVLHALAEPATQYCDVLVEDSPHAPRWLDSAWRAVLSQGDVDLIHLRKVRADGALERHGRPWLRDHAQSTEAAPFLRLGAKDGGRPQRSGRSLNALRRHGKRLAEHGPVSFEILPAADHVAALQEAFRLKRDWSRERGMFSAGYSHAANVGAITMVASLGLFTMRRLLVGGTTAAVEIGVLEHGHYYSMIQSYDLRYAQHAPGRLLLWEMFQEGDSGIDTFDFMPPSQPHKTEWTEVSVAVTDYAVVRSLRGKLLLALSRELKPRLKRLYQRIPRPIRTRYADLLLRGRELARRLSPSRPDLPSR